MTWQPIETAPSDTEILMYSPFKHFTNPARIEAGIYRCEKGGWEKPDPTHWMPLPTPPETK